MERKDNRNFKTCTSLSYRICTNIIQSHTHIK